MLYILHNDFLYWTNCIFYPLTLNLPSHIFPVKCSKSQVSLHHKNTATFTQWRERRKSGTIPHATIEDRLISPGRKTEQEKGATYTKPAFRELKGGERTHLSSPLLSAKASSPSLSLSLLLSGSSRALWRRSDSWTKLQCLTRMRFWITSGKLWTALPVSVHVCLRGKENKTPPSSPPPLC